MTILMSATETKHRGRCRPLQSAGTWFLLESGESFSEEVTKALRPGVWWECAEQWVGGKARRPCVCTQRGGKHGELHHPRETPSPCRPCRQLKDVDIYPSSLLCQQALLSLWTLLCHHLHPSRLSSSVPFSGKALMTLSSPKGEMSPLWPHGLLIFASLAPFTGSHTQQASWSGGTCV